MYYEKTVDEAINSLQTSKKGLSKEEAEKRLKEYGKNTIKKKKKLHSLKMFFSQFNSFLIYILIAASLISFFIKHYLDAGVIGAIVIINATIGFFQQYKAEKTIENLKKLIVPKSTVIRDGIQMEISSEELVPGDVIVLEAGDKVSADMRIIECENLEVNESALTGESLPISKNTDEIKENVALADQINCLFTGTQISNGTAKAVVFKTGINTVFGKIAEDLQEIEEVKTPVEKRLNKFSKQIGLVILGIAIVIILIGLLKNFDLNEMFLMSVALAVSAIPEGLPAILAIGFAISSLMMSKKNVVVRKLPAVEALGSVTVICTDKTGTLTEEKMTIKEIFANNQFYKIDKNKIFFNNREIFLNSQIELSELVKTSVLCNNARFENGNEEFLFLGDPTEIALVENALNLGVNKKELIEKYPSLEKLEFDSNRKMMSILRDVDEKKIMYSKGAPNKIIEFSTHELLNGRVVRLSEKRKKEISEMSKKMESQAFRVLGYAYRELSKGEKISENNLVFLGFSGMIDPPRMEVKQAIADCKKAGIEVKMITGDSPITAKAVGEEIGIVGKVITEIELEKMSDEELIKEIKKISIFARVTPEQKLRIARILQMQGEIVAMTGDGVNDALALKSADVGIAMGKRGTDVSRDVSDIILIDDNFASIVEGIKEGRKTYDNIKKFTKYLLAVNFSEIFLVLFAIIFKMPLPLIPLQILWINLVSDSFPSLSLINEKEEDVMNSKPRKDTSIFSGILVFLLVAGLLVFAVKLSVYLITMNWGLPIEEVRTIVLTTAILYELLFVYAIRSKKPILEAGIFSNKWMNIAVIFSLGLHLFLLYTPLGNLFSLVPLTFNDWIFILPFAFSGLVFFEVAKYVKRNRNK